jgi:long-chain acyl-CoA synthetase
MGRVGFSIDDGAQQTDAPGHITGLDLSAPTNLAHLIESCEPQVTAVISRGVETTYAELGAAVARLRGGLAGLGIGHGDRVAIVCGNDLPFVLAYLATIGRGAIAVPLNPASPPPELHRELAEVEPMAVVVGPGARHSWDGVDASSIDSIRAVVRVEASAVREGELPLDELLGAEPVPIVDVDPDSLAVLMFTSGTAGPPRAAMLTHRNLIVNIDQELATPDHLRAGDIMYGVLPLFHIFGLNVVLGSCFAVGATVVLVQRFDPATAADSIRTRGITVVPGVPPMWIAFADFDELPADTFATVRLALSGASRLSSHVADRFLDRYGVELREGYGLTEASPVVTSSVGSPTRPNSVGRVLVGVDVRVVDLEGEDVPVGDPGEILVRGDNVFVGYWNDQDATDKVLVDGWLRTGDVGTIDADGYLYLVDRVKDLIIVSGFNVYPAEVEDVLRLHPAVAEAAVVSVPHPHHGEAVKAYVVLVEGAQADEDELIEHALDHLARYKCPTKVQFVDTVPRHATGKLIRRELGGTVIED